MIYRRESSKTALNEYYHNETIFNMKRDAAESQSRSVNCKDNPLYIGTIYIPRAYAREETKIYPSDPKAVDHYEISLIRQYNDSDKTSTYVFAQLPKTKEYVAIELFKKGCGADFLKRDHSKILRGTYDELDRRILLGFCIENAHMLIFNSHIAENKITMQLKAYSKFYKASRQPKRLKKGYIESVDYINYGIFSNVEFMS